MFHSGKLTIVAVLATAAGAARAQSTLSIDRLDGADPGAPTPAHLVVIDVSVDIEETDAWTASGLRATALNGAGLVYGNGNVLVNPDLEDPTQIHPFVTCFSRPLARDSKFRFFNAGAAIGSAFDPTGPSATATPSEINVTWFSSPPTTTASPSTDGAVARIVLDVSGTEGIDPASITVGMGLPPAGSTPLLISQATSGLGIAFATFDVPALRGSDWNVHAFRPFIDATLFRYSFSDSTQLPAVIDEGPAGNGATAGTGAALVADVPPDGPASGGNRSLDCRTNGAVTQGTLLLSNDEVLQGGGFTMEAWFKWNGGGDVNSIIDYAGTEKLVIDVRSGGPPTVKLRLSDGTDFFIGPARAGEWQYVAAVFQAFSRDEDGAVSGALTTYLDDLSSPRVAPHAVKSAFGDSLVRGIGIGQHPLGFPLDFFDGLIHEPRVSLRALNARQLLLGGATARFRRGDPNDDGQVNIADALSILSFLFSGATPPVCEDAADGNDDGSVNISDSLAILGYLFLGSVAPPSPGPETCGSDLTPDALERCEDPAASCE